jgi:integrase
VKHGKDWFSSIERHVLPIIGEVPVREISLPHVLQVLEPIWTSKTETASRVRQRLEYILNWSIVSGHRDTENPARWKGHLDAVLPQPGKMKKVQHQKALPYKEVGGFMRKLRQKKGVAARCLEFTILTACRSGETRLATWDEINFEEKTWTVPGSRMKAGREHRVPLSDAAMDILYSLPRHEGSAYIFTAPRGGALCDAIMSKICRTMKIAAVPHGFRSSFKTWAAEATNFPREVVEQSLAHVLESRVEAAYLRGDLLQKRSRLMDAWSEFCSKEYKPGKVLPIREGVST